MTEWEKKVLDVATLYDADAERIEKALHALIEVPKLRTALREIADEEDTFNYGHRLPGIAKAALSENPK